MSTIFAPIDPETKLREMGIVPPPASKPIANYVKSVRTGNLAFLSGHGPTWPDGTDVKGKPGKDLSIEQGYEAARLTAISLIATLKAEICDLAKVKRVVKLVGMVNCTAEFEDHPKVINGCSDLLVDVFGERGKHARTSVGMNALPMNIAVEIEMVAEIE